VTAPGDGARRRSRYAAAQRHSTRVRWLRRVIPLASGLAVALVVAFAWFNPFGRLGAGVTLGPVSVSGTKVVMENPRLSGYRNDTRPYEVTASAAMQDVRKPTIIEMKIIKARLATDDSGGVARLEAGNGVFDTQKEQLTLQDAIKVWTEKGQEARLRTAAVDFKAGTVVSREPVTVTIPNGSIEAEGVDIRDNGKVISFSGRVRAVFERDHEAAVPIATAKPSSPARVSAEAEAPSIRP
jgi:lipopolysaccharide export system protein LptC